MKLSVPSATAQRVAMRRAAHQVLDNPKVFDDHLALRIIGEQSASALQADPNQNESSPLSPYLRAFMAARSRYAEDELAASFLRGTRQYVILGAGLDTFAYRNPYSHVGLRVFEVDHPTTQVWKRARLVETGIHLPDNLTFAPVDFETQRLEDGLREAGYDPEKTAFFSWLGVTPYLTTEAVMDTLRFIASAPVGSGIVFDYIISPSLLTEVQRRVFDALARRVASIGELWQAFFEPEALTADLRATGYGNVQDLRPDDINALYFKDRKDGLRVGSLSHLISARV
jgi:methyltransferase (TIGR00027 family)